MISIDESKIYCQYCRGVIHLKANGQITPDQAHQYHQECFNEIIKVNQCEYCSKILNELNTLFIEQHIKIHQNCILELENLLTKTLTSTIVEYLQMFSLKKLAKDCAFYEMKKNHFTTYLEDLNSSVNQQLPDFSSKSDYFQQYIGNITTEITEKIISDYITSKLQVKFTEELIKCQTHSKKDLVDKILYFMWNYYLEIPISYKDKVHRKIMLTPMLDNVNCIVFHFKLETLFKTKLDFNTIISSNFNTIFEYLLTEPISLQNLND